ncbi:hypothetical protein B0T25DRAFT_220173 [Lasiosphaeria hispida]|uniref:Caspase domain-containing protein n=1 Tax=Lasiosphaeria hispida TaxID=260671 RepID=A0AAJ0HJ83_9PEZI|nr:hypothetical protein B0T25DRAFT_220173 [Lasiosphaeria hispida]
MGVDFTVLWERHIAATRDDFFTTVSTGLPTRNLYDDIYDHSDPGDEPEDETRDEAGHFWDQGMDSVVDALGEIALQSPNTTATHSPDTPWFTDKEAYTETALSSPQGSSWSRTISPSKKPTIQVSDYDEHADGEPGTPMIEIGKGKGIADYYYEQHRRKSSPDWSSPFAIPRMPSPPQPYHLPARHTPSTPATATTMYRVQQRAQNPPPEEVHVLILTWAKDDRRGDDGQLLSPGLDLETDAVRSSLKKRGYRVQCRLIPEDYPTSAVETILDRFLDKSTPTSLLVVYYQGYGNIENDRMVFSRYVPPFLLAKQFLTGASGFGGASFHWDDVRDPLMQAPGDVLLVLDCCAAPGAEHSEILIEPGLASSSSTKQLLGVCAPYSYESLRGFGVADNFMTTALCRILDRRGDEEIELISVQSLCSRMREDLRGREIDASQVFVTQLGGGQLMDIYLPDFVNVGTERYCMM